MNSTTAAELGGAIEATRAAWGFAKRATAELEGSRKARGCELVEMLADAIAFGERLAFVVEGDLRAEGAQ